MISFISGAVAMASLVAALFFLRFWRQTRDRFFLLFSLAFGLDAMTRLVLALSDIAGEQEPFYYLARLVMFGLILLAIIDKNRTARWP
jgi:lipoprotein signal peptidase